MLHGGNLAIIPWPVIESRQFYQLFPVLKRMLDKQKVTHPKAAVFLHTMKTMMAKLKVIIISGHPASDCSDTNQLSGERLGLLGPYVPFPSSVIFLVNWSKSTENLASHRAQHLNGRLLQSMRFGSLEFHPDAEPLKVWSKICNLDFADILRSFQDLDNGSTIDLVDSPAIFYLGEDNVEPEQLDEQEKCLQGLLNSFEEYASRSHKPDDEWLQSLCQHLDQLATNRAEHVREWLNTNTIRFKSDSTEFEGLRRRFDALEVALKGSVRLCKLQCNSCQLFCLQSRHHEGPHDCRTSHKCHNKCGYVTEHPENTKDCGLP